MQVKFSELTLDMFRMLQTLEKEPQEELSNQLYDASPAPGRTPFVSYILSSLMHIGSTLCHRGYGFLEELVTVHRKSSPTLISVFSVLVSSVVVLMKPVQKSVLVLCDYYE